MFLFILSFPSYAHSESNDIYKGCKEILNNNGGVQYFLQGACFGYIHGIARSVSPSSNNMCVPRNATRINMIQSVVDFIEKHPDVLELEFYLITQMALVERWPCGR